MSYTITIVQDVEITKRETGTFGVVRQEYLSEEEVINKLYEDKKDYKKLDNGQYVKDVYDYAPAREVTKCISQKVFEQSVDNLNLQNVILAVNNLSGVPHG